MDEGGAPVLKAAYGWKATTTLAKQTDPKVKDAAMQNADSLALFAVGKRNAARTRNIRSH